MVASGTYREKIHDVVEIINLIDPEMKYEFIDERTAREGATGFLLQDQLMICGGYSRFHGNFKDYIILGQPTQTFETLEVREDCSSLVLNENFVWIAGGIMGSGDPNNPFGTWAHCLRSEKKFHFEFDFLHFYLIKSVIWQRPAMHPGYWPE